MPKINIIDPNQSYTFADYFKLNFAPKDILAYFGASLTKQHLNFVHSHNNLDRLESLYRIPTDLKDLLQILIGILNK